MMMKRLLAIAAAFMALAGSAPRARAECRLDKLLELPLIVEGDEAMVDASVNGTPIRFLVDTGAENTLLTRGGVEKLKLKVTQLQGFQSYGVGGYDGFGQVHVKEIKLGEDVLHDANFLVTGNIPADAPFQGLLGETSFSAGDLELDFKGKALRLIRPTGCAGDQVVYWAGSYAETELLPSDGDSLLVTVYLNGHPVIAEIDSGFSTSTVAINAARWGGVTSTGAGVKSVGRITGIGAERVEAYQATFATLKIGDEAIRNAKLHIGNIFGADVVSKTGSRIDKEIDGLPELMIGADFIKAHRIYVARSQRKVYFSYVGGEIFRDVTAPREPTPIKTTPQQIGSSASPP